MLEKRIPGPCLLALCSLIAACARSGSPGEGASGGSENPATQPSFVVIVVDDWAYTDLLAVRGDGDPWNDLPAVDALAGMGLSFENFYTQPLCNPTRKTLNFGVYDGDSKSPICTVRTKAGAAPPPTLAGALRSAGYATCAFGKWHVERSTQVGVPWWEAPAEYGFEHWRALSGLNIDGHCDSNDYWDWIRADDGVATRTHAYHTEAVASAFLSWWSQTPGPRFAYVCFQAAHRPYHTPPAYLLPNGMPPGREIRDQYEHMLVAMDGLIGAMLAAVDLRDTYVFLLGDNGTPNKATRTHQDPKRVKWTVYEDGVNVPLLVAGPGVRVGSTPALGHVVDLAATLCALAGTPKPIAMADSVSLAPVLFDAAASPRRSLVADLEPTNNPAHVRRQTAVLLDTGSDLFKGIYVREEDDSQVRSREFYDLSVDPGEEQPVGVSDPLFRSRIDACNELYQEFLSSQGDGGSTGGFQPGA